MPKSTALNIRSEFSKRWALMQHFRNNLCCVESKIKNLCPLGRLTVEKNPKTCLLYPQDIVAVLIYSRQLPKSIEPGSQADICSYLWGRKDSAPLRGCSWLRDWEVLFSPWVQTLLQPDNLKHTLEFVMFILGFTVLQCKHMKHMLLNTEKI